MIYYKTQKKVINLKVGKKIEGFCLILKEEATYDLLFDCDLKSTQLQYLYYSLYCCLFTLHVLSTRIEDKHECHIVIQMIS